jgi:hypothetical protein
MAAALLLAPLACAQSGPVPGQTPAGYAQDYYGAQAANATAHPASYAASKASAQALGNETRTAAFIACWQADEATGGLTDPLCAPFFTAPERALRPSEPGKGNSTVDPAASALNQTAAGAGDLANTTLDAVNSTVADPSQSPSQLDRVVAAVAGFANATVALVLDTVKAVVADAMALVLGLAGMVGDGLGAAGQGIGMGVDALLQGLAALVSGIAQGLAAAGSAVAAGVDAVGGALVATGGAVSDGVAALARAVADAAGATVDGVAAAGKAAVDAAASAADAVAQGVGAVVDAVQHFLGGGHSTGGLGGKALPPLGKQLPAKDLLHTLHDAVPL